MFVVLSNTIKYFIITAPIILEIYYLIHLIQQITFSFAARPFENNISIFIPAPNSMKIHICLQTITISSIRIRISVKLIFLYNVKSTVQILS